MAGPLGFEPKSLALTVRCFIQLVLQTNVDGAPGRHRTDNFPRTKGLFYQTELQGQGGSLGARTRDPRLKYNAH